MRPLPGPLVTVVVAISDEETTQIEHGLTSLLEQRHGNLDVILVGYGRCERVLRIARRRADRDWRVRVLRGTPADRAAARNAGVKNARGDYLAFMQGGDNLPPRAVQRLVTSLERTGSSFAVGMLSLPAQVGISTDYSEVPVRAQDVRATTLTDTPWAITDLHVGNRLFRLDFWKKSNLTFEAEPVPDSAVLVAAFAQAPSFDLLTDVTYIASDRRDGETVGWMRDRLATLDDRVTQYSLSWERVRSLGVPEAEDAWLRIMLDSTVQPLLDDAERATPRQWEHLRQGVGRLLHGDRDIDDESLSAVSRVKLWLLDHDRREALESFVEQRWFEQGHVATEVRDGRVLALLPHFGDPEVGVPDECYEMRTFETPLEAVVAGARWTDDGDLALEVFARIRHVSMTTTPDIEVAVVDPATDRRVPVQVRAARDLEANQVHGGRYQDYSWGALTAVVDPTTLAQAADDGGGTWLLDLSMTVDGVSRHGGLTGVDERSPVSAIGMGHVPARRSGDLMVGPVRDPETVLTVQVTPRVGPELTDAGFVGREVTGVLDAGSLDAGDGEVVSIRVFAGPHQVSAPVHRTATGATFSVQVPRPQEALARPHWQVRAVCADGTEHHVLYPESAGQWLASPGGALAGHRTARGCLDLVEAADTLVADRIDLVDGDVHLTGHWLGKAPATAAVGLAGPRVTIEGNSQPGQEPGQVEFRFRMEHDEWDLGALPAPVGRYWFELACGGPEAPHSDGSRKGRVLLSCGLLDTMLRPQFDETYRLRIIRRGRDAGIFLMSPLAEDERGAFARQQGQDWCRSGEIPIDPNAVYFQSYVGASATDSQLAIHEEVRRRHPGMTTYWGVADRSSRLPGGAVPVILGSRDYFRVVGSAGYLVVNIDLDRWVTPHPGQKILQTFHGYPAKSMGITMWKAKGYTPRRIASELERTTSGWDLILTPAPEMDVHYRREYSYEGEIHSAGYPRDDVLVSPDADRIREETRARLGITPDQKVVLYAPTWRDDLATNWRSAQLVRHLDLETASTELGADYVFLMRGHRFHARGADRSVRTSRLIDVTDYPEINDLILAADVAVLDYSSLRFDFALTGRPMIFLVPDLASYTGGVRGFLYDFGESAPGPLLETADEVVACLQDLPGLRARSADEIASFNQKFNYLQDGKAAERVVKAFFGE